MPLLLVPTRGLIFNFTFWRGFASCFSSRKLGQKIVVCLCCQNLLLVIGAKALVFSSCSVDVIYQLRCNGSLQKEADTHVPLGELGHAFANSSCERSTRGQHENLSLAEVFFPLCSVEEKLEKRKTTPTNLRSELGIRGTSVRSSPASAMFLHSSVQAACPATISATL